MECGSHPLIHGGHEKMMQYFIANCSRGMNKSINMSTFSLTFEISILLIITSLKSVTCFTYCSRPTINVRNDENFLL